jgi:hypothetical protein
MRLDTIKKPASEITRRALFFLWGVGLCGRNSVNRAYGSTRAAVGTLVSVYFPHVAFFAYCFHRAFRIAGAAVSAFFAYYMSHLIASYFFHVERDIKIQSMDVNILYL